MFLRCNMYKMKTLSPAITPNTGSIAGTGNGAKNLEQVCPGVNVSTVPTGFPCMSRPPTTRPEL